MKALGHTIIKSKNFWAISILIIVSFGIYANAFEGEFVWDDRTLFIQNYDRWQWKNIEDLLSLLCQFKPFLLKVTYKDSQFLGHIITS